ncbi:MAG TPA: hypothetical protein VLH09_10785, partial [Bryobacteraceae bacterium]|nr:hypothetical protein [Bryobacteraceae bacterium]
GLLAAARGMRGCLCGAETTVDFRQKALQDVALPGPGVVTPLSTGAGDGQPLEMLAPSGRNRDATGGVKAHP